MNLTFIDFAALTQAVSDIGLPAVIVLFVLTGISLGAKWLVPKLWTLVENLIIKKIEEQEVKDAKQDEVVSGLRTEVDSITNEIKSLKRELDNSKSISKERHDTITAHIERLEGTVEKLSDHLFSIMFKK